MSVTLVNSHVLIPHLPDWGNRVSHSRQWQCEVGRGLSGGEHRVAMRQRPRLSLAWSLVPHDSEEQAQMHARLRAAVKSGYAAVPFWGRGIQVASAAGAALTLSADPWSFLEAGDYVLVRTLDVTAGETWDAVEVDSIAGAVVTMTGSLGTAWGTDAWCWPLLFGTFSCGQLSHRSDWHTPVACQLRTFVSTPKPIADLCAVTGVDAGDSFDCYPAGYTGSLESGNGWAGPWVFGSTAGIAIDDLERYTVGVSVGLNGGINWDGGWVFGDKSSWLPQDDFESYDLGVSPTGGGTGWDGDWVLS